MNPAAIAPAIGATQNNHNCIKGSPPAKIACDKERAGLTEVLVIGILTKWINVNAKPMATPANLLLANRSVVPKIIKRKNRVNINSVMKADNREYPSGEKAPKPLEAN